MKCKHCGSPMDLVEYLRDDGEGNRHLTYECRMKDADPEGAEMHDTKKVTTQLKG